jgi:hypothetical protein
VIELFKPIPGSPNYEIDWHGTVRRIWKTRPPSEIKPVLRDRQYMVRLTIDGKRTTQNVHKLMQRTFMRPALVGEVVYHKNGNRLDNWINNLAYIDRHELGRRTGGQTRKSVLKICPDSLEVIEIYRSAREAGRQNHMSYQTVMDYCNGITKRKLAVDGFIYKWEDGKTKARSRKEVS